MDKIIEILVKRDDISVELARGRVRETRDEIICNPEDASEIIRDYLELEPDYLEDVLNYK